MPDPALLISCEHAVNHVPARFGDLFENQAEILAGHRAFDAGALDLAEALAGHFAAPCFASRITRLLIDHNRSPHNPARWSPFSRALPSAERTRLEDEWYQPFRAEVGAEVAAQIGLGRPVVHLAVHSFTPEFRGRIRHVDIGLLYDPARKAEKALAIAWQRSLRRALPTLVIRRNAPYLGVSDCHQNTYRRQSPADLYLGIELEINQRLLAGQPLSWIALKRTLAETLAATLCVNDGDTGCVMARGST